LVQLFAIDAQFEFNYSILNVYFMMECNVKMLTLILGVKRVKVYPVDC